MGGQFLIDFGFHKKTASFPQVIYKTKYDHDRSAAGIWKEVAENRFTTYSPGETDESR